MCYKNIRQLEFKFSQTKLKYVNTTSQTDAGCVQETQGISGLTYLGSAVQTCTMADVTASCAVRIVVFAKFWTWEIILQKRFLISQWQYSVISLSIYTAESVLVINNHPVAIYKKRHLRCEFRLVAIHNSLQQDTASTRGHHRCCRSGHSMMET